MTSPHHKTCLALVVLLATLSSPLAAKKRSTGYDGVKVNKNGGFTITPKTSPAALRARTQSYNQAGLLDQTFGVGGIVTTLIFDNNTATAALLQPDGKIIAVGLPNLGGPTGIFFLVRYNPNGSLDTTFGPNGDGTVATVISDNNGGAFGAALQFDGKIVAAGYGYQELNNNDVFILARYTFNGLLDTTFGPSSNGIVTTPLVANGQVNGVALQADGKIVAAGFDDNGIRFALVRYNSNGSIDTSFGTKGIVTTIIPTGSGKANAVVLQSDGKIVAVGYGGNNFALVRYNPNGSLDKNFGTTGIVTTSITASVTRAQAVLLQPDGKIVAAGSGSNDFALIRYNPNGSVDTSFGTNGVVTTIIPTGSGRANAVLLQLDGKIVAAGHGGNNFALVRYNPDGSLDKSFGTNGIVTTSISGNQDIGTAAVLQADGKIVVVGSGDNATEFVLARYINPFTYASLAASYGSVGML